MNELMANSGSNGGGTGSSSSANSSSGAGGSGGTSSGGTEAAGGPAITDLTNQLKQLQDSGAADLKLSTEASQKYLTIIGTFRTALNNQKNAIAGLPSLGSPGTLQSAVQTLNNLNLDVTGLGGIEDTLNNYLSYLDEFETTVKKTADSLIQSG
jgi:hypothetical protein